MFLYIQDGKALPDGPVVISPDGVFPSLYREGEGVFCIVLVTSILDCAKLPLY